MGDFVHLHLHTEYSLLDGACRIEPLMEQLKELGQDAVAITDHGVMYGAIEFYKIARKHGIKPIIGCEVYVAPRNMEDKQNKSDRSPYHMVLLCKDNVGYQNLIRLVSLGYTQGYYGKPRIDLSVLRQHSEGLICLTACLAGAIPRALMRKDYQEAKDTLMQYVDIFGRENLYVELQNHRIQEQIDIIPKLVQLARECHLPLVATNDCHYLTKEDSKVQSVLIAIQTNRTVDNQALEFTTDEFYVKTRLEMEQVLPQLQEAMDNTVEIAKRCNVEFTFDETKLPYFTTPNNEDHLAYFNRLCKEGLMRHYGENPSAEIKERLAYETKIIHQMGYIDYFLIVADFIHYAKSRGIPVGPGRGSGAGSLAAYCIGITGIDPIAYDLIFERFLNPERISMPDFDIDFCYVRRQEVIDYVTHRYGSDHVAQIITFGTLAARAAIRDVGRALGMPYQSVDVVAKTIPMFLGVTIQKSLDQSTELKELYHGDEEVKKLIDYAMKLEGMPRHASIHAAGVVITKDPVDHYVPLQKNGDAVVTQYTMNILEELGLLKMDFLGLRNLTVISDTEKMVQKKNPNFSMDNISLEDPKVFDLFTSGHTDGIFQFESGGIRQVLMRLKPERIEDLIAVTSLYRPGPMESIPKYIENRHNVDKVTYKHPLLEPILKSTYGCIVYQEQVMEICRKLAGFSYGQADLVRRAMGKKKMDVMKQEREHFLYGSNQEGCVGAIANGVPLEIANSIFDEMVAFASYAFNKSHAASYAVIAYQTAYLKCHYPKEYMAALLTSVLDNTPKLVGYLGECERLRISVLPPDVNESSEAFTAVNKGIRFGLLAIKSVGRGLIREIIHGRQVEPYLHFISFLKRIPKNEMNKRALESLISAGAFDSLHQNRQQLIASYPSILGAIDRNERLNVSGQMSFFGVSDEIEEMKLVDIADYSNKERLRMEKEVLGLYVSAHPLTPYREQMDKLGCARLCDLGEMKDGEWVKVAVVISSVRAKVTRKNETMYFCNIEDATGTVELLVFPKTKEKLTTPLVEDNMVLISGRLSLREDEEPKILCDSMAELQEATKGKKRRTGLFLKISSPEDPAFAQVQKILKVFNGDVPVYIRFAVDNRLVVAPKHLWVQPVTALLERLQSILGDEHVVYRE